MTGPEDDLPTLIGRADHINVLRYIRAHKLREPHLVIAHGRPLLGIPDDNAATNVGGAKLGDAERLSALEHVCLAAYDVGDASLAERCLMELEARLPNTGSSARYQRLLGLRLESVGDYDSASAMYDEMINDNPSNAHASRRKYCALASRAGSESEAMKELDDYLQGHPGDIAAWYQMAEMCLSSCDFTGAAYCFEEVILGCPLDSTIHCRLAEAYSSAGGLENSKLARKHMAQAVQLDPDNLRAWYGLIAVAEGYLDEVEKISSSLGGKSNGNGGSRREAEDDGVEMARELVKLGGEKLMCVYKRSLKMRNVVEGMLRESSESL